MEEAGISREKPFEKEQIQTLCKSAGSKIFCTVGLSNDRTKADNNRLATVTVYNDQGEKIGTASRAFTGVEETDFVSIVLARDAARIIRGTLPVDQVNLNREKNLLKNKMITTGKQIIQEDDPIYQDTVSQDQQDEPKSEQPAQEDTSSSSAAEETPKDVQAD